MHAPSFPVLDIGDYRLREWRLDDAEALRVFRSDPNVDRFLDYFPESTDEAQEWIGHMIDDFKESTGCYWAIASKDDDDVVGMCHFFRWNHNFCRADLGYMLARTHWNRGIMTSAINTIINYGFSHMELNRIQASAAVGNRASQRVLEKAGFTCEGTMKENVTIHGEFSDSLLYALLKREWHVRSETS